MQVTIVPEGEVPEHSFESGLSAELMDTSFRAKKRRSEAIYRCRHCAPARESALDGKGQVSGEEPAADASQNGDKKKRQRSKKGKSKPMDFNALRSHLKGRWVVW